MSGMNFNNIDGLNVSDIGNKIEREIEEIIVVNFDVFVNHYDRTNRYTLTFKLIGDNEENYEISYSLHDSYYLDKFLDERQREYEKNKLITMQFISRLKHLFNKVRTPNDAILHMKSDDILIKKLCKLTLSGKWPITT